MKRRTIWLIILAIIIIAQFIQPAKNNGPLNEQALTSRVPTSEPVLAILRKACFDCHSNNTRYPWYNHITPVNWWLRNHINEGKRELNFSVFDTYSYKRATRKLDEAWEQVEKGEMPLSSYTLIHKDAKLTDEEKATLHAWTDAAKAKLMADSLASK